MMASGVGSLWVLAVKVGGVSATGVGAGAGTGGGSAAKGSGAGVGLTGDSLPEPVPPAGGLVSFPFWVSAG
mgnify:CR=1 FL=1